MEGSFSLTEKGKKTLLRHQLHSVTGVGGKEKEKIKKIENCKNKSKRGKEESILILKGQCQPPSGQRGEKSGKGVSIAERKFWGSLSLRPKKVRIVVFAKKKVLPHIRKHRREEKKKRLLFLLYRQRGKRRQFAQFSVGKKKKGGEGSCGTYVVAASSIFKKKAFTTSKKKEGR